MIINKIQEPCIYLFLINNLVNFRFRKRFNSEFSSIEVWFTDQNSKQLEIEYKISITLLINERVKS